MFRRRLRWELAILIAALALCRPAPHRACAGDVRSTEDPAPYAIRTVYIEGGTFTMGSPLDPSSREYFETERPVRVSVASFRMGKWPITADQMCAFLNSPYARSHGTEDLYNHKKVSERDLSTITLVDGVYRPREDAKSAPANQVSWKGAVLFCDWLSSQTGRTYRLPSEAEWEYAARGAEGRSWPWDAAKPTEKHGVRYKGKDVYDAYAEHWKTWPRAPVGSHPANATPEGVMDMLSYVNGEWCANTYAWNRVPTVEELTSTRAAMEGLDGPMQSRSVRGKHMRTRKQGWIPWIIMEAGYCRGRSWTRSSGDPIRAPRQAAQYGFRVVLETDERGANRGTE